jgi:hypothetical protein
LPRAFERQADGAQGRVLVRLDVLSEPAGKGGRFGSAARRALMAARIEASRSSPCKSRKPGVLGEDTLTVT